MKNSFDYALPDSRGYFGEYGGSFIPEQLQVIMDEITAAYLEIRQDENFHQELAELYDAWASRCNVMDWDALRAYRQPRRKARLEARNRRAAEGNS